MSSKSRARPFVHLGVGKAVPAVQQLQPAAQATGAKSGKAKLPAATDEIVHLTSTVRLWVGRGWGERAGVHVFIL